MSEPLGRPVHRDRVRFGETFRTGLKALGPDRKRLAFASGLAFLTGVLETVMLYIIGRVAVALTSGQQEITLSVGPFRDTSVAQASLVAGILLVIVALITVPLSRSLAALSARVIVRMRSQLIDGYMSSSWAYRSTHREGYLQTLIGEYCQRGEDAIQQLSTVVVSLCTVSMVCIGAAIASPLPSIGAAIGLTFVALVVRPLSRLVKRNSMSNAAINREVVGRVAQITRLSEEIAVYDVGDVVAQDLDKDVVEASHSLQRVRTTTRMVPTLYQYGALGVVLVLITTLNAVNPSGLSEIAPLVLLMIRALAYLRQLLQASQASNELSPYLEAIDHELGELRANPTRPGTLAVDRFDGMTFDAVNFEYFPGHPVLTNVGFNVVKGEVLGVTGASGGGKTTLSQLVLRLRQPTSGRILVGSVDLSEVDPVAWTQLTAFVPQDNKLIYATVAENIRFFRSGHSEDEVRAAAIAAHLDDEICALPEGYDTLVGPGARDMSGGQCQRLGIARALLGRPQLLVLDEPTSALDPRSESLIRRTLDELSGTVTIIMVAHRKATLEICDRVLRVSQGHVHEEPGRVSPAV